MCEYEYLHLTPIVIRIFLFCMVQVIAGGKWKGSISLYLCGRPAVHLTGGNGVHAVQHWCPSSIRAGRVGGEGP